MALLPTTIAEARNSKGWARVIVTDQGNDRVAELSADVGGTTLHETKVVTARLSLMEMTKTLPLLQKGLSLFQGTGNEEPISLTLSGEKNGKEYRLPTFTLSANTAAASLLKTFRQHLDALVAQAK